MLMTTTDAIPGKTMEILGLVSGVCVVQASGKLGGATQKLAATVEKARTDATVQMAERAKAMGATAIVGVQFATSDIGQGYSEVIAYGTAAKLG